MLVKPPGLAMLGIFDVRVWANGIFQPEYPYKNVNNASWARVHEEGDTGLSL